ncbi:hypothetical protein DPEC_G00073830 [Dallia pectoralis]|uniref:Uncharacterized protein n=1 Tax=Dallia pectoralis TaxID=75939 RepID=A0ACC2H346_DALPE|nr:hypothetical protein DPEC_G00073830 [Dallia pectoralis]
MLHFYCCGNRCPGNHHCRNLCAHHKGKRTYRMHCKLPEFSLSRTGQRPAPTPQTPYTPWPGACGGEVRVPELDAVSLGEMEYGGSENSVQWIKEFRLNRNGKLGTSVTSEQEVAIYMTCPLYPPCGMKTQDKRDRPKRHT